MKRILLSFIFTSILLNNSVAFASETNNTDKKLSNRIIYTQDNKSSSNNEKHIFYEYSAEKTVLPKIAMVVDLGDKDNTENTKNPVFSMLFSFFIPGAGQIYNGEILKGILLFIGVIGLTLLDIFIVEPKARENEKLVTPNSLFDIGALATRLSFPLLWVYNWGSAYQSADPVYQKKLLDEEKKKKATPDGNISKSYGIDLFSYKF